MTTYHDSVAALPVGASANKQLLRDLLDTRMPYALSDGESLTGITLVDPASGAAPIDVLFLGRTFHFDPADTTTANDGTTCLVSADGRRYKLASGADVFAYSVLDITHTAPPASPSLGDAYLVAAAATGAWVGKDGYVATKTARGWEFVNFGIGRFIYNEATDTYYHRNTGGAWVSGLGNSVFTAGSVPITAVIGANASFVIKVENQTTNAPPASPTAPTAYIIGPSPTGAWAGNASKLAMCLVNGSFTIITPVAGDTVYDKTLVNSYRFDGATWKSSAGALFGRGFAFAAGSHGALVSAGGNYSYSPTSPPVGRSRFVDSNSVTYTARAASVSLKFNYQSVVTVGALSQSFTMALYRDNETTPLDWTQIIGGPSFLDMFVSLQFYISSNDALSHTYAVSSVFNASASGASAFNRSSLEILEYA